MVPQLIPKPQFGQYLRKGPRTRIPSYRVDKLGDDRTMGRVATWAVPLEPFPDRRRTAHAGVALGSARFAETGRQRAGSNNGGTCKGTRAAAARSRWTGLPCNHVPRTSCKGVACLYGTPRLNGQCTTRISNATAIVETAAGAISFDRRVSICQQHRQLYHIPTWGTGGLLSAVQCPAGIVCPPPLWPRA